MHLFDLPEVAPRYALKKRNITMPDTSLLKSQQAVVFEGLKEYILDDSGITGSALLDAPGGTGKTYVVSMLIEYILSLKQSESRRPFKIACTATTNKAVKVTYRQANYYHVDIEYRTLHSLLGLREQITNDGQQIFVQDPQNKPDLEQYDLIFIDEVSMMDDSLFIGSDNIKGVQDYIEEGAKVILTGDSCQIPPINRNECMVFTADAREMYNIKYFTMDEIVRQAADNPIIALATEIRKKLWIPKNCRGRESVLWEGDKGVYFIDHDDEDGMENLTGLIEHVFTSENFKEDPDFAKVIAYRNVVVNAMNDVIRKMLYGDEAFENRILIGEKLLVNTPVFDTFEDKIVLPANEELDVLEYTVCNEEVNDGLYVIPYYSAKIQHYRLDNSKNIRTIKIPTLEGQLVVNEILDQLAKVAKALGKSPQGGKAWRNFFEFKREFADVTYNYAITAHKSQGSTYGNAIVLEYDLDFNRKIKERQRIKYTAFTRPAQRLFVVN